MKSVPVYALQIPESSVVLRFTDPETGEKQIETAALISFVYNLTEARRPQPSVEPEKTIYKNLRPWKRLPIPNYVVISDGNDLVGADVVAWDGKKSLQGAAPWGRPIIGKIMGQVSANGYEVQIDSAALTLAKRQFEMRQAAALERLTPAPPPVVIPPEPPVQKPVDEGMWVGTYTEVIQPEAVAVEGTPVEEDKIDFNYTGDPFTINVDGHFVGDDGFVVPMDFDEFYTRYPKYVLNWVKKRLNRFSVDEDVEDWTQDLLIHMKWLPQASKHRNPGANGRKEGCADVVETFNPYQQYGASERRFRNYINFCLANKFNTVQSKRQKNPVCRPGNVPFGASDADPDSNFVALGDEFVHQNSEFLTNMSAKVEKQHDDRLFTNQFKDYVRKEDPSIYPAIEALESCGPMGEAAEYMGVTDQEFARYRTRLKQLADFFLKNQQAPKQRKPYKKRAAA